MNQIKKRVRIPLPKRVPVVDLFAGPGGLGEGFAAYDGLIRYDVSLSIEKERSAKQTLELRSFLRQFLESEAPDLYYDYLRGQKGVTRDQLWERYPRQAAEAERITWRAELGKTPLQDVMERIRDAIGNAPHWVLLGGPPCQAYSVIGRARMSGTQGFGEDRRHTLYREYLKIVAAYQPTVFVMENVKGILSSKHKRSHIFQKILADMRDPWQSLTDEDRQLIPEPAIHHNYQIFSFKKSVDCDYDLESKDYLIKSECHGVPQARHRVILLGVRSDYSVKVPVLLENKEKVSLRNVLEGMPSLRSALSRNNSRRTQGPSSWFDAIHDHLKNFISDIGDERLREQILNAASRLKQNSNCGLRFIAGTYIPDSLAEWLYDPQIGGVLQHESRAHMSSDLCRYLFSASYAALYGKSPRLQDFPPSLLPNHKNIRNRRGVAHFEDRFKVQLWDCPASTITSHIAKDGHYYIHPDFEQVRSLTVREAARLQTFPENYFFEGNRTEAYQQIGNAVPPYLAYQLADVVSDVIEQCKAQDIASTQNSGASMEGVVGVRER